MTETPIHDKVANYLTPLLKSSERIGSARALLIVTKWISDEIAAGNLKPSADIKKILNAMEQIRGDILLRRNEELEKPTDG